jgi:hypothetical protein
MGPGSVRAMLRQDGTNRTEPPYRPLMSRHLDGGPVPATTPHHGEQRAEMIGRFGHHPENLTFDEPWQVVAAGYCIPVSEPVDDPAQQTH